MNWILTLLLVCFLFSGEPPLIYTLHDYVTNYLKQNEARCK